MKKNIVALFIIYSATAFGQSERISDFNNTNWLQIVNTISLNKKWSLHTEYQWRRTDGLKIWQQSLLRIGVNRKLNENISLHAGYGWIKTFRYGEYPIASAHAFPEHRIYEQLSLRHTEKKWIFNHRFRVEQRWLSKFIPGTTDIDDWIFLHRFRYQFRLQHVLWNRKDKQLYSVFADEIFIGAGKQLGENIFDQNRLFLLAGFKLNKQIAIEAGYFNQTLQQGRKVNNSTIIQRNNGVVVGFIGNF